MTHANAVQTVRLRDFFPDARKNIIIARQPNLFLPDQWTKTFAQGLQALTTSDRGFEQGALLEVGVGTGINMAGLLTSPRPPASFIGVDLCHDAVRASTGLAADHNLSVTLLASDLLSAIDSYSLSNVRHIVACIPQVPADVDLSESDNAAHYYTPTGTRWDTFGLGLNAALLQQSRAKAPQALVTLNLAGRPGLTRLHSMFNDHGYDAKVIHATMVPQHHETSLASLAALEGNGHEPFEFFADVDGSKPLSAAQAEDRRLSEQPVHHKIYVMKAVLA